MVTNELILVLGMVIALLAVPGIFGALVEGTAPRGAAVAVVVGGGMIIYAISQTPGGIALNEVPDIIARVVGSFL
jgi:hypothetical protein